MLRETRGERRNPDGFWRGATAMTPSAHLDTFARDNLPPRAQWPDFLFDLPELELSRAHELRRSNCSTAGSRPATATALPHLAGRDADLRATGRAGEPHRQRAHARSRPRAGQPRAAARPQQPDDGRGLSRRHQGRRRRGRDHAAAARQGDRLPDRQGEDRACALRRTAWPTRWRRRGRWPRELERVVYWGSGTPRRARSADGASPATSISPPATPRATTSA